MKITKYIHSCVLIEEGADAILFDPGMFTFQDGSITPEQFKHVSLVVITHNHPDHIDVESLKKIVDLSGAPVLTTPEIQKTLSESAFVGTVYVDAQYTVGAFSIRAIPADHEKILASEIPQNYGYLVNGRVLHPGDSYADSLTSTGADTLLLPLMAPWTDELTTFEFGKKSGAKTMVPIHDGYAKDFFLDSRYQNFQKNFEPLGIAFKPLKKPGDSVEV